MPAQRHVVTLSVTYHPLSAPSLREPDVLTDLHPVVWHHVANTLGWPGLRPLQAEAVEPLLAGHDALLLAPTAGGKTEAAAFPLLYRDARAERGGACRCCTSVR